MKTHVLSLLPGELEENFQQKSIPRFRTKQLLNWIYENLTCELHEMKNLPKTLKKQLTDHFDFFLPEIVKQETSTDGTSKFLFQLADNTHIEMVHIPHLDKNTFCISSQAGCSRGCKFCATASLGLSRNLAVEEIVAQIFLAKQFLKENRLTNIVFMGMGEPLDNLENVLKAVKILQNDACFNFSPRRITISTCGVIPGIRRLAESDLKVKLAVSLNAAIQTKREELMPVTKMYSLPELKKAILDFRKKTAYRITFEYVMIKDFNMGNEDVKAIYKFLGDITCKLNLIKWNEVPHFSYKSPSEDEIEIFRKKLEKLSSAVTFRNSRGADISAACGQLAGKQKF
ncbi:MAG: 23S rRNA (adenine(2503)-C(2))-methyltransferase RlmN [Candidatus Cloacimonetes bacterium]|nr:23S rRNA (adenine(2503)-C(2))-methyltransferase RlmN [Candidatus Cloacimonadota bacterium]MCF7812934.1 23S rRNA (adenine(2503)-C(2))-methyltransferase RlmN [Candidatus Cloacimonadota bacterium]MCF7867146.1 23S rRNA (adenine(2503)-C(2))-methyltransferase RlmN [Candidatus Cloacimonadota bacterium]MCF7882534.1 23S rRNA (adenine(2503)-C(2))-methyltransferase RlmN [Candidatus Cloacimonadota bacterium]